MRDIREDVHPGDSSALPDSHLEDNSEGFSNSRELSRLAAVDHVAGSPRMTGYPKSHRPNYFSFLFFLYSLIC